MLLEDIKISDLPSVYLLEKDSLPNCAGIYFVSNSKNEIIYIGRTINLVERWKNHHRFQQLKRFNKKDNISISWISFNDTNNLSNVESELIDLYKPPLNWSKVVSPIRKITPSETALQQSLQQLAKLNTMVFGFNSIVEKQIPTIYFFYPVYGKRGLSGSIRSALKNINKKASMLKWKEYKTEPKSLGKFGYWETIYNGIRIELTPFQGLVHFMEGCAYKSVAGVEFMAFSQEQLEVFLEDATEVEKNSLNAYVIEEDPIPLEVVDKYQPDEGKDINRNVPEVEPWEELEPMAEGEVRKMNRQFVYVDDVEIEVCINANGKYFVRYNVYWCIVYGNRNINPNKKLTIEKIEYAANSLPTIRWCGYRFRFETIVFEEDDMEVESILLPLAMFEDLMKDIKFGNQKLIEEIKSGEYKSKPDDSASIKLFVWLQRNSLQSLLQTKKH
ncbi:MAG: GIY-YIG nuclease family protein [Nostocaceae cyanobacterium]|nr:GIY-YIG nuclease family protein [Nostocaceae cyanobacterium]